MITPDVVTCIDTIKSELKDALQGCLRTKRYKESKIKQLDEFFQKFGASEESRKQSISSIVANLNNEVSSEEENKYGENS